MRKKIFIFMISATLLISFGCATQSERPSTLSSAEALLDATPSQTPSPATETKSDYLVAEGDPKFEIFARSSLNEHLGG